MDESRSLAVLALVGLTVFLAAYAAAHVPAVFWAVAIAVLLMLLGSGGGGGDHPCGPGGESGTNP